MTRVVIPRRPRLAAASRRRQLLDVALASFARSGLDATTMDDIAHEAGVTKPLLYQHFKSKRALFLELLDDVVVRIVEAVAAAASSAGGPRQQVEAVCNAYFRFMVYNEAAIRLLLDSTLPYDAELAEAMRRVDETIASALRPLIQADIDPDHQRVLAAAVVGMAKGVTRDWLHMHSDRISADSNEQRDAEAELLAKRVSEFAWAGLRLVHRD
ncbi:MAG: helix-turn-helix domain-containing protein [Acidimicrobiales bacterium]|jgi:AcrR family transcriptional regulator